ncbi:hypothetical protein GCM10017674_79130 [Streptomyces gardneri]|uniref:Uncharacterized protein n=1 Tax=Streptomyces gardneri TaxID=66892 RepID=A0A4Y3RCP1_9ACTN|nr:hypothetical protein SGA01_11210 [Streptomyces gardneri]GHH22943.1 hypothetical protein GCM10017674_79130 [Streptomyces gardneri]
MSAELQAGGIQLELLTGPLTGIYDPNGIDARLFRRACRGARRIERGCIREKTPKAGRPRRPKATTLLCGVRSRGRYGRAYGFGRSGEAWWVSAPELTCRWVS